MLIVGHRGARGLAPENTLASIQAALDARVDMIEFDVRITGDGIPVLHHDFAFRLDGKSFKIAKTDYEQLRFANPNLTTLSDALGRIGSQAKLCIEVKKRVRVEPVAETIRAFIESGGPTDGLYLGSKDQKALLALHREFPDLPIIVIEPWSSLRAVYRARQCGTRILSMNQHFLWRGFIAAMAHRNWQLYAYTLNDPHKARKWARAGLCGVITDFPDRFQASRLD
jgi:glycerophosphoryl diester phosphodiesterase